MSLIRKHVAVLQAWACLALVVLKYGYFAVQITTVVISVCAYGWN